MLPNKTWSLGGGQFRCGERNMWRTKYVAKTCGHVRETLWQKGGGFSGLALHFYKHRFQLVSNIPTSGVSWVSCIRDDWSDGPVTLLERIFGVAPSSDGRGLLASRWINRPIHYTGMIRLNQTKIWQYSIEPVMHIWVLFCRKPEVGVSGSIEWIFSLIYLPTPYPVV